TSTEELPGDSAQIAIVDGEWVILDGERQVLHREGGDGPIGLDLGEGALLQGSSEIQDRRTHRILIADSTGLVEVGDAGADRIAEANGVPARPQASGDELTAAWVGASTAALW